MVISNYHRQSSNLKNHLLRIFNHVKPIEKTYWMFERSENVWSIMRDKYKDSRWKESFRVNRSTFNFIVQELKSDLEPKFNPISTRLPVPVDKQVAVTLYKLSSCCEYRVVADVFGIHKTTVKKIFYRYKLF